MNRNSDPWLRFYVRTLNNPKVQQLADSDFKGWVNLLCLAKETDGVLPSAADVAYRLRLSERKAKSLLTTLRNNGLIDGDAMHDWHDLQYKSDSSTERVKRYRERSGNVTSNGDETFQKRPRSEQIRTEKSRSEDARARQPLAPNP